MAACGMEYLRWDATVWWCQLPAGHLGDHYDDQGEVGWTWWAA